MKTELFDLEGRSVIIRENDDTKTFDMIIKQGDKKRKIYSYLSIIDLCKLGAAISTYAADWMIDEVYPKVYDEVDDFFTDI